MAGTRPSPDTWPPNLSFLFGGSFRLATLSIGLPELKVKTGLQMEGFFYWSPPRSLADLEEEGLFGYPFPIRASLERGW